MAHNSKSHDAPWLPGAEVSQKCLNKIRATKVNCLINQR